MGVLSSRRPNEPDQARTSDPAKPQDSSQLRAVGALVAPVILVGFTGFALVLAGAVLAHEIRRVRIRWLLTGAAATLLVGIVTAGGVGPWAAWFLAQVGHFAPQILFANPDQPHLVQTQAAAFATVSAPHAVICQLIAGAPLAFLLAAAVALWRRDARAVRGTIEGPEYSNRRPVGIVDQIRERRERQRIAAGHYMPQLNVPQPGTADLHQQLAEIDPTHVILTATDRAANIPDHIDYEPADESIDDISHTGDADAVAAFRRPSPIHQVGQRRDGNLFATEDVAPAQHPPIETPAGEPDNSHPASAPDTPPHRPAESPSTTSAELHAPPALEETVAAPARSMNDTTSTAQFTPGHLASRRSPRTTRSGTTNPRSESESVRVVHLGRRHPSTEQDN